jgi:Leucine-rich repeat (LRR) protein
LVGNFKLLSGNSQAFIDGKLKYVSLTICDTKSDTVRAVTKFNISQVQSIEPGVIYSIVDIHLQTMLWHLWASLCCFVMIGCCFHTGNTLNCSISDTELSALHDLYDSTAGTTWSWNLLLPSTSMWSFPANLSDPCSNDWQGVGCLSIGADDKCVIVGLQLPSYGLQGYLPFSIANLSNLAIFNVSDNTLSSTIPSSVQTLSALTSFDVSENFFEGFLPLEIESLSVLSTLILYFNHFSGPIPSEFGRLTAVTYLDIYGNSLAGPIPSELGYLTLLTTLYLGNNSLSGSLPSSFGALSLLQTLDLSMNNFTGTLPQELEKLVSLKYFSVYSNQMTSSLPSSLGALSELGEMDLSGNDFTGSIPVDYGQLSSLQYILLNDNSLKGSIPDSFRYLSKVIVLDGSSNSISGSIPSFLASFSNLTVLWLQSNSINGTIPSDLSALENLVSLDLSKTSLSGMAIISHCYYTVKSTPSVFIGDISGNIPSSLTLLPKLAYLNLSNTKLTGTLPPQLFSMPELVILILSKASFSGPVPSGDGPKLQFIYLRKNLFNESFPPSIVNLPSLRVLDAYGNQFNGQLPLVQGESYDYLEYLDLGNNSFTGELPSNWSTFRSLRYFYADRNHLEGSIPAIYLIGPNKAASVSLRILALYDNSLNGALPEALWSHTDLEQLLLNNNALSSQLTSGIMELQSLINLDLSYNRLTGCLQSAFVSQLRNMTILNLAGNSFTGPIPANISSPRLRLLALSSNCFSGSIPESICSASYMETLLLNTLSSGSQDCIVSIPPLLKPGLKGIIPMRKVEGTVPECLFRMANLTTLHLFGNLLGGAIPASSISGSIQDLQLSYNSLTGNIPEVIQTSGQFATLCLQNNMLSGTLMSSFAFLPQNSLSLSVNRFSGVIPQSFYDLKQTNVLLGNWFDCGMDSKLPPGDPSEDYYSCGSNQFVIAMIVWLTFLVAVFSVLILCAVLLRNAANGEVTTDVPKKVVGVVASDIVSERSVDSDKGNSYEMGLSRSFRSSFLTVEPSGSGLFPPTAKPNVTYAKMISDFYDDILIWLGYDFSGNQLLSSTQKFCKALIVMYRRMSFAALFFSICILFYVTIKQSSDGEYRTVSIQQLWLSSALFLTGYLPAVIILIIVLGILGQAIFLVDVHKLQSIESQRILLKEQERAGLRYSSRWDRICSRLFCCGPITLHLINLVVAIAANAIYVENLPKVPPRYQLIFQAAMSIFKIVWVNFYIPRAMKMLHGISTTLKFQTQVIMLLTNYLVGPALATAGVNKNCLYFVIRGIEAVEFSYSSPETLCAPDFNVAYNSNYTSIVINVNGITCSGSHSVSRVVYSTPPVTYSYQCGFSFVVDYIPVLLYSYLMAAIVIPTGRLVLLYFSQSYLKQVLVLGIRLYSILIPNTIHDFEGAEDELRSANRAPA